MKKYSKILKEEDHEIIKVWKGKKDYYLKMELAQESLFEGYECECACGEKFTHFSRNKDKCERCTIKGYPVENPEHDMFYCHSSDEFVTEDDIISSWPDEYEDEEIEGMLDTVVNVRKVEPTRISYDPPGEAEMNEKDIDKIEDAVEKLNKLIQELEPEYYEPSNSRPPRDSLVCK